MTTMHEEGFPTIANCNISLPFLIFCKSRYFSGLAKNALSKLLLGLNANGKTLESSCGFCVIMLEAVIYFVSLRFYG
jgi:hypothetical protein